MSTRRPRETSHRKASRDPVAVVIVVVALVGLGLAVLALTGRPGSLGATSAAPTLGPPTTTASGITVDAARVELGRVALDRTVSHTFRITNEGVTAAKLGSPKVEVIEGC